MDESYRKVVSIHDELILKKLLIKVSLRQETEQFRQNALGALDGTIPMLTTFFLRVQSCPLLEQMLQPLKTEQERRDMFVEFVRVLPVVSQQMRRASGRDPLVQLVNELGNFWTLVLVTKRENDEEIAGREVEESVVDDDETKKGEDAEVLASSRRMRGQVLKAARVLVRKTDNADEILEEVKRGDRFGKSGPLLASIFKYVDHGLWKIVTNPFRREEVMRKTSSLSNPLYGPLLSATNPVRYAPRFLSYMLRTRAWPSTRTLAEMMALRSMEKKLKVVSKGVDPAVMQAATAYVDSGRLDKNAYFVIKDDVDKFVQVVGGDAIRTFVAKNPERMLEVLKTVRLMWQKKQIFECYKTPEMTWIIDKVLPLLGGPLGDIFNVMRVGQEIRNFARALQKVAESTGDKAVLEEFHEMLFAYAKDTLSQTNAEIIRVLLAWLHKNLRDPTVIDIQELLSSTFSPEEELLLWGEVEQTKMHLRRGGHFGELAVPHLDRAAVAFKTKLYPPGKTTPTTTTTTAAAVTPSTTPNGGAKTAAAVAEVEAKKEANGSSSATSLLIDSTTTITATEKKEADAAKKIEEPQEQE